MEINKLKETIHNNAIEKGFWDNEREVGTLLMLCTSELSEALEADRKDRRKMLRAFESDLGYAKLKIEDFEKSNVNCDWIKNRFETTIKDTFEDELADTIIRILDICGRFDIDIEKHIDLKLRYNKTREHKHGKNY